MRVGVLITSVGDFGQKGFYNAQELGLAKELDKLFDEVLVYKAVRITQKKSISLIDGCEHATCYQIPVASKGINGMWDCDIMDSSLDVLIYFSDTQLSVPGVYRWCRKNGVRLFPYIGVAKSHSKSRIKRLLIDFLFMRNVRVYRRCTCFAKTSSVERLLNGMGISDTMLMPVGLDTSLLKSGYDVISSSDLKIKYGYSADDKVVLFVGRLIEEKQPVLMLEILTKLRRLDCSYKLLMVGKGSMSQEIKGKLSAFGLTDYVKLIPQLPNSDMWELYCLSDVFVNLNRHEIFGMAILEAMYYGCKVVAWAAPGSEMIIENGRSGFIVESVDEVIEKILNGISVNEEAHRRICDEFTWKSSAERIGRIVGE